MPTVVSRASGGSKTGGSTLGEILVHWMLCWPDTPNRRDLWRRNPKCRAAGGWPWLAVTADSLSAFPGGPAAIEAGRGGRDAARTPAGGGPAAARATATPWSRPPTTGCRVQILAVPARAALAGR